MTSVLDPVTGAPPSGVTVVRSTSVTRLALRSCLRVFLLTRSVPLTRSPALLARSDALAIFVSPRVWAARAPERRR
jgi:hypothetical protein